jgi:hypothetical protein
VIFICPFCSSSCASIFFWHSGQMLFVLLIIVFQLLFQLSKLRGEES